MFNSKLAVAGMVFLLGAAVACGGAATDTPSSVSPATPTDRPTNTATPPPATPTIPAKEKTANSNIQNLELEDLTIEIGTIVVWIQQDDVPHTTTAGVPGNQTGEWDSDFLSKEDTFSHTFNRVGTFQYFCRIHPSIMQATVTVVTKLGEQTPTPTTESTPVPTPTTSTPTPAHPGATGAAFTWNIEEVDEGVKPALALDSAGTPYVAYMLEDLQGFVKVAVQDGSAWDISTLDVGYFYGPGDIAIGPDDVVHVSYHNHQDTRFKPEKGDAAYAVFKDGKWEVTDVFNNGHDGWDNRIAVDSEGRPHMSAIDPEDFGGPGLEYYLLDSNGEWQVEIVGTGPLTYKYATSIAIDPQGTPHITFYNQGRNNLRLATRLERRWTFETVDSGSEAGLFSYLIIDNKGSFHVSYLQKTSNSSGTVKYATKEGQDSEWSISEVGTLEDLAFGFIGARNSTSLALDRQGNPWIAYTDQSSVKLTIWDGSSWQTQTVATAEDRPLGQLVSLKIDTQDLPHIAYFEVTETAKLKGVVMYATGQRAN